MPSDDTPSRFIRPSGERRGRLTSGLQKDLVPTDAGSFNRSDLNLNKPDRPQDIPILCKCVCHNRTRTGQGPYLS